ncbi:MAG: isoprenylcysteine carboxylmethyltransferase family protein [Spirochaetes bacterium]|nr:isoprenylcysteine carboxylmethyltransferase family protein [Spirochaetota bacterium]
MTGKTPRSKASRPLKEFKNLTGVGVPLLGVGLLLEVIAIIVRRWVSLPSSLPIGIRIILTVPCIVATVSGLVWFNRALDLVGINFMGGEKKLVTHEPFAYTRHPLYSTLLIGLPPLFIIWCADLLFVIPWVLIFIISHYVVRLEERDLIDAFGDEYRNYKKYVPSLIPYKGAGADASRSKESQYNRI